MRDKALQYALDELREETSIAQRHESPLSGKRPGREKAIAAKTETERRPLSAYTVHNLDTAIAHLEIAMSADKAMAIFGSRYWYGRVLELLSTPGILDFQERRLQCLLDGFAGTG
jgi:hypothetical protein